VAIERPIFVTGLPRTGTTALHRLLAADPAHQGLQMWLTPGARAPAAAADLGRQPGVPAHLPTYSRWLSGQDWTSAYRRHRRNLQLIGLPDRDRRWVLKNPSHLFALDALLTVYPDACVIQTHREARTAIASVCSLAAQATAGWSGTFTGEVTGRDQLDLWARGLERFTAVRAKSDPAQFCDVAYDQFVADPLGTIESVYRYFGLTLSGRAADAMRALHAQAAGSTARPLHSYVLSDFGLTGEQVDERFA
jgi:Ni/Co efflux regulator RcnB